MAQSIRPMMNYAEVAMPMANAARGNAAMNPPNPGRKEPSDGGDYTKVTMNPQFQMSQTQGAQRGQQNMMTQQFQGQAAAKGMMTAQQAAMDDAKNKAQMQLATGVANTMEMMGIGGAMTKFNQDFTAPGGEEKYRRDLTIQQAMAWSLIK